MKNETYYFSHDYNARNDYKIKKLITKLGYEGYGLFWAIIEDLYNNDNNLPLDYEILSYDLRADAGTIKSLINDFDLFNVNDDNFNSNSIQNRLNKRSEKSNKAKLNAEKRWSNANAMQTHSEGNAIKERKGKEKKGKEIKTFNSMPKIDDVGEIPLNTILSAIELVKITKQVNVSKEQVKQLWSVFLVQNVTGENYYASETKIHQHFINWIKNQHLTNDTTNKPKNEQRFDARVEYANRYNQISNANE